MGNVNRGKDFEERIRLAFNEVPNTTCIRLIDPQNGYAGVRNICDFVVYHHPVFYLIECKSCYGNTLPFSNITDNQWSGLIKASTCEGVCAGYMIWFVDHNTTIFVPASTMLVHKLNGDKSINIKTINPDEYIQIHGEKRRVLFNYDLAPFIKITGERYGCFNTSRVE